MTDASGNTTYEYDAYGNMCQRGAQAIAWDNENHPVTVSENSTVIAEFVYDGDGNRAKKIEGGQYLDATGLYYYNARYYYPECLS
jgi:YD repeat-containing protein